MPWAFTAEVQCGWTPPLLNVSEPWQCSGCHGGHGSGSAWWKRCHLVEAPGRIPLHQGRGASHSPLLSFDWLVVLARAFFGFPEPHLLCLSCHCHTPLATGLCNNYDCHFPQTLGLTRAGLFVHLLVLPRSSWQHFHGAKSCSGTLFDVGVFQTCKNHKSHLDTVDRIAINISVGRFAHGRSRYSRTGKPPSCHSFQLCRSFLIVRKVSTIVCAQGGSSWLQVPIFLSWVVSPIMSAIICTILFLFVRTFILRAKNSYNKAFWMLPIFVAGMFWLIVRWGAYLIMPDCSH